MHDPLNWIRGLYSKTSLLESKNKIPTIEKILEWHAETLSGETKHENPLPEFAYSHSWLIMKNNKLEISHFRPDFRYFLKFVGISWAKVGSKKNKLCTLGNRCRFVPNERLFFTSTISFFS